MLKKLGLTLLILCAAPLMVVALVFLAGYALLNCLFSLINIKPKSREIQSDTIEEERIQDWPALQLKHV